MRYRILGPLSVSVDGQHDGVTAARDRTVLAMLLLYPHRVLGPGELIDAVWGVDPPSTARGQLQTCVSRLRRLLPSGAIRTSPGGYRIDLGPDELDAQIFDRLVADARAADRPTDARRAYREAIDLWRGPALAEIDSEAVRRAAAVLDERSVVVTEDWVDVEITAGYAREMVGVLVGLVERYPLRERLRGQLMTALHRAGRPGDALAEFRRARQVLADELGIEPGRELQELHAAMLAGELSGPPAAEPAEQPVRCLPRTVGDFTGRESVVRRMVGAIEAADDTRPVVAVIDGMAGSGKTTLALHVAALLADQYPDAHLFIDLHGHSAEQPLEPAVALLVLLRQLGVDAERIPPGLVDRIALWRTELARRRALVLFDNAGSSAQIADLIPTAPGNLALVTGRRRLVGLDGVHPESLPVLAPAEAVALLARIAGERVHAEPEAAAEVARRCGGLPLAVRLAGARLAHRSRWRVADLVRRLGESVLPELAAEDRSVADAFALSYRHLPERTQRVFRLLGVCPGTEFDALTVAAVSGLRLDDAQDALDDLIDVHLVEEPERDVYRLHDLLREFAAALAGELTAAERTEALRQLLDQQLHAAAATDLPTYRMDVARDIGAPVALRPDLLAALSDRGARLERERRQFGRYVAAAVAVPELVHYAWQLARATWRQLFLRGYLDDVYRLQQRALEASERNGNRAATAMCLNYLASVHYRRCELDYAVRLMERCIVIRRELGDRPATASAMINLANLHTRAGRWVKGIEVAHAARRFSLRGPLRDGVNVLATSYDRLGRYDEALWYYRLRMMIQYETGDLARIGSTLLNIIVIKYRTGRVTAATAHRQMLVALRVIQRAEYPYHESEVRDEIGRFLLEQGRVDEAVAQHRRAVALGDELHDAMQQSRLCHGLGHALHAAGDDQGALAMFQRALRLGQQVRLPYPTALAQAGLGGVLITTEPVEGRRLLEQARTTLAALGAAELPDVEKQLAELGGEDHLRAGETGERIGA